MNAHDRSATPRAARPASLLDVARDAGVSTGTVSRALSRPEMISAATRERVLAAAERLGYVANGAARALAMQRTRTIGAIVPRFGTSSFPTMIQSLEATLAADGYTLLLSAPEHGRVPESRILRALIERGVDAVALLGEKHDDATLAMLARHRLPAVLMWCRRAGRSDCVGFDEKHAGALLIAHLAELGHRQVGFIGGRRTHNERARARFAGVRAALARHGMVLSPEATVETDYGFAQGFDAMQAILARRTAVTAVVCGNDYLAIGALSALDRAGIEVPRMQSVVSFNDNDFAAFSHPPLTTVRLPIHAIGEQAGHYLIARLNGLPVREADALPVELVVRESSGVARQQRPDRPAARRKR
ncbi:MAG: LacI family DNA-binding transcriptional regulator [Lautropia sp.]